MDYEMFILMYLSYRLSLARNKILNDCEISNVLPNLAAVFL